MAGRPSSSPLLVQVVGLGGSNKVEKKRLDIKLEKYFQSGKESGGGECNVQARDPDRGIYAVCFQSEEVKNQVKACKTHSVEIGGKILEINILPGSEATVLGSAAKSSSDNFLNSPAKSLPASDTLTLQSGLEKKNGMKYASDVASITKKIFVDVSATLNMDLLSKEQRDQVIAICPALKIDSNSVSHGIEKVSGDYDDIQKLHYHLERLLTSSHHNSNELSHLKRQERLEETDVDMKDTEEESKGDLNEEYCMKVPSGIFEYFRQVFKEQVEELEERFNVKLTFNECGNDLTSLQLSPLGTPNSIKIAQQMFVTAFQKAAADVKQETIHFADSLQLATVQDRLIVQCKRILVKRNGNTLILHGPAKEISAAKDSIEEIKTQNMNKKTDTQFSQSAIEVDVNTFEFIESILKYEIQDINQRYETEIMIKHCPQNEKQQIFFKPKKYARSDRSFEACQNFIRIYQKALGQVREKVIPLKLAKSQEKRLDALFSHLQSENPQVSLRKNGEKLTISGLPEQVCKTEKHIMEFLNSSLNPSENIAGMPTSYSSPESTFGACLEQSFDDKRSTHPPQKESNGKAQAVEQEEQCSICMDKIEQKEVLSKCKHAFCRACIKEALKHKPSCPVCNMFYGKMEGNQPPGKMAFRKIQRSLPGHDGYDTIEITYNIPDGLQTSNHPNPGRRFYGTFRTAYLPDNKEGQDILRLLLKAFDQKLIFTVGQSRTTGITNVVTWNDIHHKTTISGGPEGFGYPDPNYLKRVREELKAKGIE